MERLGRQFSQCIVSKIDNRKLKDLFSFYEIRERSDSIIFHFSIVIIQYSSIVIIQFAIRSLVMIITLNGEKREFDSPISVAELLNLLNLKSKMVLVERNLEIVPRDAMNRTQVVEGDTVEILRLVGGG